jgi:hypothetical protein
MMVIAGIIDHTSFFPGRVETSSSSSSSTTTTTTSATTTTTATPDDNKSGPLSAFNSKLKQERGRQKTRLLGSSTTIPRQKDCKQSSHPGYALDLVLSDLPQETVLKTDDGSNQTVSDAKGQKGNSFILIQELEKEINVLESELKASKAAALDSTKRLVEAKSTKVALQETLARLERTARKPLAVAAIEADIVVQSKKAAFLLASSTAGPESLSSSSSHKIRACQAIVQQHEAELSRLTKERKRCSSGDAARKTPAIATIEAAIFVQRQKEAFLLASSKTGAPESLSPSSSSQKVRACQAIVQKLEAELARLTKDRNGDAVGPEQREFEHPMERDRVLFVWNGKKLYTIDEVKTALDETEQTVLQLEGGVMARNQSSADQAAKALQLASRIVNQLAKVASSRRHGGNNQQQHRRGLLLGLVVVSDAVIHPKQPCCRQRRRRMHQGATFRNNCQWQQQQQR